MFNPAASAPTFSFSGAVIQAIAAADANSITNVQFNTVPHAAATTISTDIAAISAAPSQPFASQPFAPAPLPSEKGKKVPTAPFAFGLKPPSVPDSAAPSQPFASQPFAPAPFPSEKGKKVPTAPYAFNLMPLSVPDSAAPSQPFASHPFAPAPFPSEKG